MTASRPSPRLVLAVLMAIAAVVLLWITRGQTFFADEWGFFANYRGHSPRDILQPNSGNLIAGPAVLYKTLIAVFGAESYAPFRIVWVALVLTCAGLFYALARRPVGDWAALAPTTLLLFFGAAWEVTAGPLGTGVLLTIAAGLGALLCLEKNERAWDLAASLLIAFALACYTPAVAFAVGAAVHILVVRGPRHWRDLWVVALPLVLYAGWRVWAIQFHQTDVGLSNLLAIPSSIAASIAAVATSITGTYRNPAADGISFEVEPGRALAVALVAIVAARFAVRRRWPIDNRVWVWLSMALVFWALVGANLGPLRAPEASRYQLTAAIFVLLLLCELGAGRQLSRRGAIALVAVTGVFLLGNLANLFEAARFLRDNGEQNRAQLAALELVGGSANPDLTVEPLVGAPSPTEDMLIFTFRYLSAASDLGSPAEEIEEVPGRPEEARQRADRQMVRALVLNPGPRPDPPQSPPGTMAAEQVSGGTTRPKRNCTELLPELADATAAFTVPAGGFSIEGAAGPVTLKLRRFGDGFAAELPPPAPGAPNAYYLPPDEVQVPWHLQVSSSTAVTICPP